MTFFRASCAQSLALKCWEKKVSCCRKRWASRQHLCTDLLIPFQALFPQPGGQSLSCYLICHALQLLGGWSCLLLHALWCEVTDSPCCRGSLSMYHGKLWRKTSKMPKPKCSAANMGIPSALLVRGAQWTPALAVIATTGLAKARYLKDSAPARIQACRFRRSTWLFLDCRRQLAIAVSTQTGFPETAYIK